MLHKKFCRTREDGIKLYRTYSDNDHYIIQDQTGSKYSEALDIENTPYTYTETDEAIEVIQIEQ